MRDFNIRILNETLSIVLVLTMMLLTFPIGICTVSAEANTTLTAMRARAEAIVNYTWVPSQRISTWNGNTYNGKTYFEKGESVVGVPYTLFTTEIEGVSYSLCSLAEYKSVASSNYSATAYCVSVPGTRTGPVYGSCCADFVCEVFGGKFMSGSTMRYHSVAAIKRSDYGTTSYGVKASSIQAGDAVSNTDGTHIIWIGDVTDTYFVIYEQAPPVARKCIAYKSSCVNSDGYLVYGGSTYSIVTKTDDFIGNTAPTHAVLTTNYHSYEVDETVIFTCDTDGTPGANVLWIYCPNGDTLHYDFDESNTISLGFGMTGHYEALVQAWNGVGSLCSERIVFVVGLPTYARLSLNGKSFAKDEEVVFTYAADGTYTNLWLYLPDGSSRCYSKIESGFSLGFGWEGHYQAMIQTWTCVGPLSSERVDFVVGAPTYATLNTDCQNYAVDETATFTCNTDGNANVLWIYCPNGESLHYDFDESNTIQLGFGMSGHFQALVQAWNGVGSLTSERIDFVIGVPTYTTLQASKQLLYVGESIEFNTYTDGTSNSLWIYYPDGSQTSEWLNGSYVIKSFTMPGEYRALAQSWNRQGSSVSDYISFVVAEKQYTVKFNGNGSTSGSMNNQTFQYNVAQKLAANTYMRSYTVTYNYNGATGGNSISTANANATFNGWATSASGSKVYEDKQSVQNLTTTGTVDLYANWTLETITLPTPVKTGYSFEGWFTDSELTNSVGSSFTPDKDCLLYAKWKKIVIVGDADGDGEIGLKDVVQITRYLAGGWDVTVDLAASDVNHDGEVNLKDAVLLRRYLAGGWGVQLA